MAGATGAGATKAAGATKPPASSAGKGPAGPGGKGPRKGRKGGNPNDVDPTDQDAAVRENKRQLAAYDRKMTAAYEAGRSGKAPDPDYDDDEAAAHSSGVEEAAQPAAAPPIAAPVAGGPGGPIKGEGAPAILGIVAYCLVINWFRYGWPGVTGWFSAKFINKPTIAATRTAAK
jgi:hypothetical protein